VNESGEAILAFYIFQEKRFCKNYIEHCEAGATMAMQPHAWMTSYLFSAWISHFLESVRKLGGISPEHCHRFILDGHNSHVTLEVVMEAKRVGLDLLTLPSHTSHALQPLDVSVFKPFKQHFWEYRDFWTSRNLNQPATKQTLAQWVALSLNKALSERNIRSGFAATRIFPFDRHAVDKFLSVSRTYKEAGVGTRPGQGGCTPELHDPLDHKAPDTMPDHAAQGPDSG
jgi:flagellar biosynthesis GTPase FlhF